jgi:hypothetical protein
VDRDRARQPRLRLPPIRALAAAALAALAVGGASHAAPARDDTAWLQAKLDAGGAVFLPKLDGGACYAARGLWVSRDDTTISSDGACVVALGPGEPRLGPVQPANAVFNVTHSRLFDPQPVRVAISDLGIVVPAAVRMSGIAILGHEVTLDRVSVEGAPKNDVALANGAEGPVERVAILDSVLTGATHDVVSAWGALGLRVEGSTLRGGRAGLHIRAGDAGEPTADVTVRGNTIAGNAGAGVVLDLFPAGRLPVIATDISIGGNHILRNGGAGIQVNGFQRDGLGRIDLGANVLDGNRGGAIAHGDLVTADRPAPPPWRPSAATLARAGRDDTPWLQARLDAAGGTIFLPALPNGGCYATRGLWVSHDETTITSDGACIVSLGPGQVRLRSPDGDPIAADAVFFVNRSELTKPTPVGIRIENLRIIVPSGQSMSGVSTFGHDVTLSRLAIGGAPKDDIAIGGRANGNGLAENVAVLDSTLAGAGRNAISAFGVIGLRVERNTIEGVRDEPRGQPAAGIDVEPDERSQPTLAVRIAGNTFRDNAGVGILLSLDSNSGPDVLASGLEVAGNIVIGNGHQAGPPMRAGIAIVGGQDGGAGTLALKNNVVHDNGGDGILMRNVRLLVDASGNDVHDNG